MMRPEASPCLSELPLELTLPSGVWGAAGPDLHQAHLVWTATTAARAFSLPGIFVACIALRTVEAVPLVQLKAVPDKGREGGLRVEADGFIEPDRIDVCAGYCQTDR